MSVLRPCAIGLGANLGNRRATLEEAVRRIRRLPGTRVARVSPWLETEPVGGPPGQPRYLNGALVGETELAAAALLFELLAIERALGRRRVDEVRNGPRTLDLDLLLLGDERHDEPGLRVPHPRLEERLFVLRPLAAVAPELVLPSGRTVLERRRELERRAEGGEAGAADAREPAARSGAPS